MEAVSTVHVYPTYGCGNIRNTTSHARSLAFWQGLATRHSKPIYAAYTARIKPSCLHSNELLINLL